MCSGIELAFHLAYSSVHGLQKSQGKTDTSARYDIATRTFNKTFVHLKWTSFLQILRFISALLVAYKGMSHKGQLIFLESK